jgi:hypothetical protein
MRALHVVTVFSLLLAGPARGEEKGKEKVRVEAIELRLFGEEDGKIHPFSDRPNAYGMYMDILVVVKLKGKLAFDMKPTQVVLKIDAKGWSDEATGDHGAWRLERKRPVHNLEGGVRYLLFVVPYAACYPEARFAVSVVGRGGGSTKARKVNMGCAE